MMRVVAVCEAPVAHSANRCKRVIGRMRYSHDSDQLSNFHHLRRLSAASWAMLLHIDFVSRSARLLGSLHAHVCTGAVARTSRWVVSHAIWSIRTLAMDSLVMPYSGCSLPFFGSSRLPFLLT